MEILQKVVAQTNSSKLAKRVEKMEKTFEPREKIDSAIQSDAFAPLRSEMLALTDYVGNYYREFLMSTNYTTALAN